ncbi:ferredoxin-type protein NapF [Halomonas heilongjiangensis]|uniref:Ferredoxin-type protein NapF n=1 Tax=Halomonas heilongjiangensis TaxID=1387883 RepID=A0A2N7TH78_9GAMM|nr:ferredoxin-type protein NapF [Halomonas heilongjiangensis]PMR67518.1 ferredoxin-type protein NapF [Halomonas heilongjiangensis]PXX87039.1 ferredoxin-type protein NapF [Halomonas heilongjiangensis]
MHNPDNNNHRGNDGSRRQFFRSLSGRGPVRRPPWTGDDFLEHCTRCDACIDACPEGVLHRGGGGYPEIRFERDGCSLCGACVEACEAPVFDAARRPFPWRAELRSHCLALANIHCQSCQDACEWRAIRFLPELGRPPRPRIDSDACTGCGACQALCPNDAIAMSSPEMRHVQ